MAFQEALRTVTMPIGAAIARGIFVTVNTSGQVVAAANGADAVGVTLEAVTTAQYNGGLGQTTVPIALIQAGGKAIVVAQASVAIAVGDRISCDTGGFAILAAAGDSQLGVALEAASNDAAQEEITILLDKTSRLV